MLEGEKKHFRKGSAATMKMKSQSDKRGADAAESQRNSCSYARMVLLGWKGVSTDLADATATDLRKNEPDLRGRDRRSLTNSNEGHGHGHCRDEPSCQLLCTQVPSFVASAVYASCFVRLCRLDDTNHSATEERQLLMDSHNAPMKSSLMESHL